MLNISNQEETGNILETFYNILETSTNRKHEYFEYPPVLYWSSKLVEIVTKYFVCVHER